MNNRMLFEFSCCSRSRLRYDVWLVLLRNYLQCFIQSDLQCCTVDHDPKINIFRLG